MSKQQQAGFTLIEILVVTTITVLMLGTGIVGYLNFNDKQRVLNTAEEVKIFFRLTQTQARNGVLPSGCTTLSSYQVSVSCSGDNDICMKAVCTNPAATVQVKGMTIDPTISYLAGGPVTFKAITGDIPEDSRNINLNGGIYKYRFVVSKGGEISTGDWY